MKKATKKILIVDDNRDAADSLAELASSAGHSVRVAYHAVTGLMMATELVPDIIMHDVGMPDLDGYQVAARLRKDPRFAKTLLVAVTAWCTTVDRRRSKIAGFDFHFAKPFDFWEVMSILENASQI